ncbi:MAG: creatininase family protein [Candidatus Anstonellaceae archaeon]
MGDLLGKALLFGELTSAEVQNILKRKKTPVVILPMGATEAHGSHLPLWTDSITPFELAKRVSQETGALVLPPLNYGFCYTLRPWTGTISLTSRTFAETIKDITRELVRNGFDKLLFLNGHGANASIAGHVLRELSDEFCGAPIHGRRKSRKAAECRSFRACIVSWWEMKEVADICSSATGHADENEESIVMALTGWKKRKALQKPTKKYFGRLFPMPKDQFTQFGYVGKVGNGTVEKGEAMVNAIVKKLVQLVKSDLVLEEGD